MPNKFTEKFFHFNSPIELLTMYDASVLNEDVRLYPWQYEFMECFARDIPIGKNIQQALIAANGSGKSQYILAPCIVWMTISFDNCLSYITSSSAEQLDTQTERYIRQIADNMNRAQTAEGFPEVWDIKKRHLKFYPTDSFIDLLATDESAKAEGKHPLRPGAEFLIAVDEGKSIAEDIYEALDKCTGFTRKLYVSSPGKAQGEFYKVCTAQGQDDFKTENELGWNIKRVTAFDCKHIPPFEIENLIRKHGLHDPHVRSTIFAEFTSVGEDSTCLTFESINECIKAAPKHVDFGFHAGLDLSAGGDEQVFSAWKGNKLIGQETAHLTSFEALIKEVINWFHKYQSQGCCWEEGKSNIHGDEGGVGWAILGALKEKKYFVNPIMNQWRAYDNVRYANRGTELWFNFKRFVEECQLILPADDKLLKSQLSNRYRKIQDRTNKLILESKQEAKRKGHPSPDRADAAVLAWAKYIFPLYELGGGTPPEGQQKLEEGQQFKNAEDLALAIRSQQRRNYHDKLEDKKEFEGNVTQTEIINRMLRDGEKSVGLFGTNPALRSKYKHLIR